MAKHNHKYFENILTEPTELRRSLSYTLGPGRGDLQQAASMLQKASAIYITGIGSSWHAGMAIETMLASIGKPAHLVDASELLHFHTLPRGVVLIVLSRSGKSVEIVKLLDVANAADVPIIAVTNTPESPLAKAAAYVLKMEAAFDHLVSVTMYSALTLVGGLLITEAFGGNIMPLTHQTLDAALMQAEASLPLWQQKLEATDFFDGPAPTYFLARGSSLASCYEARLLWEEAAKSAACSMTTGGFRHGPQEMLLNGARIGLFLDPLVLRIEDLALLADLRKRGIKTMLIGQNISDSHADLTLPIPPLPKEIARWQFLFDIIPAQLAAYHMAIARNADPDTFGICPYVITTEGGL
ncbi:MAG: SIS domain-containing protein [Phycisphaerales bacterium]|nr:SIS domain-containing protein [Phycisphaerales bacterium]